MNRTGARALQVVATGGGATRRWWIAEPSLGGLLARGPYFTAQDAWAVAMQRGDSPAAPRLAASVG